MMVLSAPEAAFSRAFPAETSALEKVDLSFRVSGTLAELAVKEGVKVNAGDVLARLDTRDFENHLAEAKSALGAGQAELGAVKAGSRTEDIALLEAQVASARAQQSQAQTELARQKRMLEQGIIAKAEYERTTTANEVALKALESAEQELAKARSGARPEEIQAAESRAGGLEARVRDAQSALDDAVLRAPFSGVVAAVLVDNHQEVQAKTPVLSLQNIGGLKLKLQVPGSIVSARKEGVEITYTVTFLNHPGRQFEAVFQEFSTQPDPATQSYTLTLAMEAPEDIPLLPGMPAEVTAHGERASDEPGHLLVPVQSVATQSDGASFVWVVSPETYRVSKRPVTTGIINGNNLEILDGLKPGETIVIAGVSSMLDGMAVRPLEQQ